MEEATVDALYLFGSGRIVGCTIVLSLHIHHIVHVADDAVTDGIVAADKAVLIGYLSNIFVQLHLVIDHRTNLQEIELTRAVVVQVDGKLNLHGSCHLLLPIAEHLLQEFGQRENSVLQHAREGDNLSVLPFVVTIVDALVVGVEGGDYPLEGTIVVGIAHGHLFQIEGIVHLKGQHVAHALVFVRFHIKRIKLRLCLSQCNLHLAGLQHLVGMMRTDTQAKATIDDVLAQSESQFHDALVGTFVADGIVVNAASHTRYGGIEATLILLSYHLLQDDSHLLLVNDVGGGHHVVFRGAVEDAGIDTLDGIGEHFEPHILVVGTRYHVGGIDASERLIVAVFEQGRGTDGHRATHHVHEGHEVIGQLFGQTTTQEVLQDFLVGQVGKSHLIESIGLHKSVEDVGAEHHCLGNLHRGILVVVEVCAPLDDVVEEG